MKKAHIERLLQTAPEEVAIKIRVLHAAVVDSMRAYNQSHKPALLKAWKAAETELTTYVETVQNEETPAAGIDAEAVKKVLDADMSTETIAHVFGLTPTRVRQLTKEGMPRAGRNRYHLPNCVQWYTEHLKEKSQNPDHETKRQRSRLLKARADKAVLEVKQAEQALIDMADVKTIWANHIVAAKTKLLGMPSKLAPILAEITDPAAIQEEVKRLVFEILTELANDKPRRKKSNGTKPKTKTD